MSSPKIRRSSEEVSAFTELWRRHGERIARFCRRHADSAAEADEVQQRTAVRAWRGFGSLRDRSVFEAWALSIARHELARWAGQRRVTLSYDEHAGELSLSSERAAEPGVPDGELRGDNDGVRRAIAHAVAAGHLTAMEGAVLQHRLEPGGGWRAIGERLEMDPGRAAVLHCRAVPRLRVFLFVCMPGVFGGIEAVRQAYDEALRAGPRSLTAAEALVFDRVVLRGDQRFRPLHGKTDLRAACAKVARFTPNHFSAFR